MAIDLKYGRVTLENSTIGEDEPIVVFRASDVLLPKVLAYYRLFCNQAGSPKKHLDLIDVTQLQVLDWQKENVTRVPSSENYKPKENT